MSNKINILFSLILGVIISILIGLGWYYVYVPHKEMDTLLPFKDKLVTLYADNNIYPSPPGKPENVQRYMEVSIAVEEVKRELNKESVFLRTENARKLSALLLKTANEFEKFCKVSANIERGLYPENANKPATKEFDKSLDNFDMLKSELEDTLFPQLEGYFK